jgi:tetratricopeptide (TPR) repeat protein
VVQHYAVLEERYRQLLEIGRARIKGRPEAGRFYREVATYMLELSEVQRDRALLDALTTLDLGIEATAPNTPLKLSEQRAALLVQLERLEDAREAYEQILEDHPTSQAALDFLAQHKPQNPEVGDGLKETKSPQLPDKTDPRDETQPLDGAEPPDTQAPSNP